MQFRLVFGTEGAVQKLEILFSREESVLCCHPHAGNDVVLNETTQRFSGCRNEVLVVSIGDIVSFSPCDMVLCKTV